MIYVKNARIYTPDRIINNSDILIDNQKIKRIIPTARRNKIPCGAGILDARGRIVCPGFIDVHLQGAGGYDFLDGSPEAMRQISKTLAQFGTTSFLATTVFKRGKNPHIENIVAMSRRRLPEGHAETFHGGPRHNVTSYGARLLGIHLEGPFINARRKGMIRPGGISKCSQGYFNKVLKATAGKLKMITIAPELKGAVGIIKGLNKRGIIASFGHSDAGYEEAKKGIVAGITHATHIFNAMRPLHHRDPAGLTAMLLDDRVSVQLISDGVHVDPAVISLIVRMKGIKNIVLITDSMSSQGLRDGKYSYDGLWYRSKKGACRYKDGTLIGTALPLNRMMRRMAGFGIVSLLEVIQMATINPAKVIGVDAKKGSIEEGKDADLVIMDKNFNVETTIIDGELAYVKKPRGHEFDCTVSRG